jgi:hypothetical protein
MRVEGTPPGQGEIQIIQRTHPERSKYIQSIVVFPNKKNYWDESDKI